MEIKKITYESHTDFINLLRFRYKMYIKEFSWIKAKHEFEMLQMEFDKFDKFSTFIVLQKNDEILGCARIIKDSEIGLPIYEKVDCGIFKKGGNVEIGRLILQTSNNKRKYFVILINEIMYHLMEIECDYILIDTFKNSESYKILKKLGFKESGFDYYDSHFECKEVSTILFYKSDEMEKDLAIKSNKSQNRCLKYYSKVRYNL